MRHLLIIGALCAAISAAHAAVYTWSGVPYIGLDQPMTIHADDVQGSGIDLAIMPHGQGWVQYQPTGQLSLLPAQHGDLALLTLTWSQAVSNVSIDISGLINGNFVHEVGVVFFRQGQAVEHSLAGLHSVQEQGGWLSNVVQWSHDGRATVVTTGNVDTVTIALRTRPGTSSAAPYWSTLTIDRIAFMPATTPIPEPALTAWIVAGVIIGLIVSVRIIRGKPVKTKPRKPVCHPHGLMPADGSLPIFPTMVYAIGDGPVHTFTAADGRQLVQVKRAHIKAHNSIARAVAFEAGVAPFKDGHDMDKYRTTAMSDLCDPTSTITIPADKVVNAILITAAKDFGKQSQA